MPDANTTDVANTVVNEAAETTIRIDPWFALMGILFIIGFFFIFFFILKWRHESPKKKSNPIIVSILLSAFIISLFIIAELWGILEPGWNTENGKWLFPLIIFIVLGYNIYASTKLKAIPFEKQLNIAWDMIWETYRYEENVGETFGEPLIVYKVIEKRSLYEDIPNALGSFLLLTMNRVVVLLQLNIYTGAVVYIQPHPTIALVDALIGKQAATEFSAWMHEFKDYGEKRKDEDKGDMAT